MRKTDSKKLETRDFISVGIFSLIYAVVAFVIGGVAQMTPVTFPFMPMIVALFTGTVFMLYVAKIPKKGALSILGVIAAILLFVTHRGASDRLADGDRRPVFISAGWQNSGRVYTGGFAPSAGSRHLGHGSALSARGKVPSRSLRIGRKPCRLEDSRALEKNTQRSYF